MNEPLPIPTGKIELNLEERDTRILGSFFAFLTLAFSIALSPPFGVTSSWLPAPVCFIACGLIFRLIHGQVRALLGRSLIIEPNGIELLKDGHREFRTSWGAIATAHIVQTGFQSRCLRLSEEGGRCLGEIPLGQDPVRFHELVDLLSAHLPTGVTIQKLIKGATGTLGGRVLRAISLSVAALASLVIAFQGMSAAPGSLLQTLSTWLLFGGMAIIPFALLQWRAVSTWSKGSLGDRYEHVTSLYANTAVSDLYHLAAGLPASRKASYKYPPALINLNLKASPESHAITLFAKMTLLSLVGVVPVWAAHPGYSLVVKVLLTVAIPGATAIFLLRPCRKFLAELVMRRNVLNDEILIEHRAVWVIRGGKRIPARVLSNPKSWANPQDNFGSSRMRIPLEVGDETFWYDPSAMYDEEGLALLAQPKSPATLDNAAK